MTSAPTRVLSRRKLQSTSYGLPFTVLLALLLLFSDGAQQAARAATLNVPSTQYPTIQSAIDAAQFGDTIILQAGTTFQTPNGPFILRYKTGGSGTDADYITIQSSAVANLPAGVRVGPANSASMPKLETRNYNGGFSYGPPVIVTEAYAHHYKLIGLEITADPATGLSDKDLIAFGDGSSAQNTLAQVPHHITLDRCYVHVASSQPAKRGVALNSASTSIINSYIAGFKVVGVDSQAICMWNGPGPYSIINNYLEGAGENIIIIGGDNSIPNLTVSDVEIRRNLFSKPLSWKPGHPTYAGTPWTVKNLLELKAGKRITIDGNIFEYCWQGGQDGNAIGFAPLNPAGNSNGTVAVLEDILFTNNIVSHAAGGVAVDGRNDEGNPNSHAWRVTIRNNLFIDINESWGETYGRLFNVQDNTDRVTIEHNTAFNSGSAVFSASPGNTNFISRNNIFMHDVTNGLSNPGDQPLNVSFPAALWTKNVQIAGGPENPYYNGTYSTPAHLGNYFPLNENAVGFVDYAGGNYRLASTSPYKGQATDGKDIGVDFDELNAAQNGNEEDVIWTNAVGVTVNGNSLTKSAATAAWNAGASSNKAIISGDGYVEFSAGETNTHKMCGLSFGDANQGYADVDFALYPNASGLIYIYEGGVQRQLNGNGGIFGSYTAADRLRVAVESGSVKYYKNQQLLYTSAVAPTYPLRVDTALYTPGANINNVVIAGNVQTVFPVENVVWTSAVGVTVNGNNLTKSAATTGWNAGAVSTKALASGDGFVEFTVGDTNKHKMCGLSNGNTNQSYTDIDFALYPNASGLIYIYEGGIQRQQNGNGGIFGTYTTSTRLSVSVENGAVKYRKDGVLLYTSALAPTYPLRVDTSLYAQGASINNVVLAGNIQVGTLATENVVWTNASNNVAVNGNNLTKSSGSSNLWDAGASSTKALAYGDGYVEFGVGEANTNRMCGLSNGDTNKSYSDIDFALYPSADGTLRVYEKGNPIAIVGSYSATDVFRVSVEGGVVKYWQNGVLKWTSSAIPNYPLLVDTSLYTPNSTINNVVISGYLTP